MAFPASKYSDTLAEGICDRLANGEALKDICTALGLNLRTIAGWEERNMHGFRTRIEEARRVRLNALADECLAIADDCPPRDVDVKRASLRITTRLKLMDKLLPAKQVLARKVEEMQDEQEQEAKEQSPGEILALFRQKHAV